MLTPCRVKRPAQDSKLIKSRSTTAIIVCIAATLASALLGFAYAALIGADRAFGAVAGAAIAGLIVAFEVFVVQGRVGEPLRHLPLWVLVLISTIVWILSIAAGILIITPTVLNTEAYPEWYEQSTFLQDATFFLAAALLVYFGDTINTTARLRGLAKKIQRGLVISAALLEHMRLPDGVRAEDMGAFELSGKAEATRVYAVHGATS